MDAKLITWGSEPFHPNMILDGKLVDDKGTPRAAAWNSRGFRWAGCVHNLPIAFAAKERTEGEPTRCGGRCAAQALLSRSCCHRPVSLPIFRFLQSTELRNSFLFVQQLFRESPSRALGGSVSGVSLLSFAMLFFFVLDRLPQVLFFLSSFVSSRIMVFPLEGRGDFRRWCERLCSFGLLE